MILIPFIICFYFIDVDSVKSDLFFLWKMGTIKDRNIKDITESERLRSSGKNTQNYTKKVIKYRIKLSPKTPWKRAENQVYLSSMHRSLSNGRQDPASKITLLASLSAQRLLSLQLENGQKMEWNRSGNRSGLPFWVVVIPFSLKMVHIPDGTEFPWTGQMRHEEASRTQDFLVSL